ncbi:mitochondrial fission factor-like isoform X1 [Argiope bruennichi]|nr:mitochondrial fission factor-like isoform X1 [Argiope bruennichi]
MSLNSTPGHTSNSSYESHYDPSFTAEITAKMHVPDKISIFPDAERRDTITYQPEDVKASMNVPDRILVAGDNKHIPARESLPELKFETPLPYQLQTFVLAPPPDVLTVEEYPYPSVDIKPSTRIIEKKKPMLEQTSWFDFCCFVIQFSLKQLLQLKKNDLNESALSSVNAPEEEIAILRKQVRHLSRRVLAIEQESQQRQQREIIMYTLGIAYFFIKGLVWLHRHF